MSVAEVANTTVTVLGGTTEDRFGDPLDANLAVFTSVPAFIAETGNTVQDPTTPTPRIIRQVVGKISEHTKLTTDHRLLDERTGEKFIVLSVTRPRTLDGEPVDLMLALKRVD